MYFKKNILYKIPMELSKESIKLKFTKIKLFH